MPQQRHWGNDMRAGEIFSEIERLMYYLWPTRDTDRVKIIAYRTMVKGVRIFKKLIEKSDLKETIEQ